MKQRPFLPVLLAALALFAGPFARGDAGGPPTFNRDIAPLLFKRCAACHRPGEAAPFPLLSYRDVRKRAGQIREAIEGRQMPPWKPAAGHGDFRDSRALSKAEIDLFARWVKAGAAEGEAADLPAPPKFPTGWRLGKPDLVVVMPKAYTVPAAGPDVYRNFVLPMKVPAGKYVRAMEYRPSNRRVVHHALLAFDVTKKLRERDGKDGQPGFSQSNFPGQMLPGNMAFWTPGKDARPLPEGVALRWPDGADFVLQLHLHPSGKPEQERSTVGFYLSSTPPTRSLSNFVISYKKLDIPAGEKAYRVSHEKTTPADADVYGVFPHMHLIGKEFRAVAFLPDGTKKSLLRIDDWDFNWQGYYEYRKPVFLPKGTRVVMECRYDNSAENPSNPHQPPRRVRYGEQTDNEMAILLLHAMPRKAPAEDLRQKAKEILRQYDTDGDGKLNAAELAKIPAAAKAGVAQVLKRFDRDGDGKLDVGEIEAALRAMRK
jgi:mono/diheme cytochrome c family protein